MMEHAFQSFQHAFGAHLRDPRRVARPQGLPARRANVYAELVFNNLCGFVDACFPVSRQLLGERRWRQLCRLFLRQRPLMTPWFRDIPGEFARFLADIAADRKLPAWLPELAHYEWAELAVDIMDTQSPPHDPAGDLMSRPVVVNPALLKQSYAWPVHRIGPDWRPRKPVPTCLVVYRNAADAVRFCEINPLTARLLDLLIAGPGSGRVALSHLAVENGLADTDHFRHFGRGVLESLRDQGILLGSAA